MYCFMQKNRQSILVRWMVFFVASCVFFGSKGIEEGGGKGFGISKRYPNYPFSSSSYFSR